MRRKIQITPDGQSYTDMEQEQNQNASPEATAASGTTETAATNGNAASETAAGVSPTEAAITALQAEIEDLRARAEDAEKRLLYTQAEFQNVKRRMEEESSKQLKYANSEFIKNLLPVLDNFERALKAAEQNKSYDALIGGVNGTLKQLLSALEKAGVKPIEAVGQEFDPNYHEAIGHAESDEHPANTVTEELQKGYTMHDRVLRPTLVKVAQG